MSVDLVGHCGRELDFSNSSWRRIIHFAKAYGWEASNVSSADEVDAFPDGVAASFAEALERGLSGKSAADVGMELTWLLVEPSSSTMFVNEPI